MATNPSRPYTERIFGLDVLRAAAISGVLLGHISGTLYGFVPYSYVVGGGGFGVELFFVLSGFLIGRLILRDAGRWGEAATLPLFYLRRWLRTLPLFWVMLAVNVAIEYAWHHHRVGWEEALGHLFFLRNFASIRITFMPESWSLAVEEWFYLLFPAALWLLVRGKLRFQTVFPAVAAGFWIFSLTARIVSATDPSHVWSGWQRCVVLLRFDALMPGVLAAWLEAGFPEVWRRWRHPCAIAGGLIVLWAYMRPWADAFFNRTFLFTVFSLGFALLLPAASVWQRRSENFLTLSVRRVAAWSYALYLLQLPWFGFLERLGMGMSPRTPLKGWTTVLLQLAGATFLSAFAYQLIEKPVMDRRNRAAQWLDALIRANKTNNSKLLPKRS